MDLEVLHLPFKRLIIIRPFYIKNAIYRLKNFISNIVNKKYDFLYTMYINLSESFGHDYTYLIDFKTEAYSNEKILLHITFIGKSKRKIY